MFDFTPIEGLCEPDVKSLLGLVRGRGHRLIPRHPPAASVPALLVGAKTTTFPAVPRYRSCGSPPKQLERRRPESNRCRRLCRPLRNHSATSPRMPRSVSGRCESRGIHDKPVRCGLVPPEKSARTSPNQPVWETKPSNNRVLTGRETSRPRETPSGSCAAAVSRGKLGVRRSIGPVTR